MELRHLRYFIAVAEERSFLQAARRLRVAQPALSKQVRNLEAGLGVRLFDRLPRGVRLTQAGDAFLAEARFTLEAADRAVASARQAAGHRATTLEFSHGDLSVYGRIIEDLLGTHRREHPDLPLRVTSRTDAEQYAALREHRVDVAAVPMSTWPVEGFGSHRLFDISVTGVLLASGHPLAAKPSLWLRELQGLTWLHSRRERWPGYFSAIDRALLDRGLVVAERRERAKDAPNANVDVASGEAWAMANETYAAQYLESAGAIVYRPFLNPPIPAWIALVWMPESSGLVERLVETAVTLGLTVAADGVGATRQTAGGRSA